MFMARAATSTSGTNTSLFLNFSPMTPMAAEQPLVQDLLHRNAFVDGLLNQFFHDLGFAPLEVFGNVCQNAHTAFPF